VLTVQTRLVAYSWTRQAISSAPLKMEAISSATPVTVVESCSRSRPNNKGVVYSFDLGLGPFVSLVSTLGKVGKTVEVLGQGFTGTTAVAFNGTAATFTAKSDTYLTTTVPSGATTGFVTVTTPSGTLTSNKQFRVKP
jgi:hypothetical protein